jgi:hypothetical protein
VYHGPVRNLSAFNFSNVLRHPSCFYFFSASAIPTAASPDLEDAVMQRDICWLTGETSLCLRQADCVLLWRTCVWCMRLLLFALLCSLWVLRGYGTALD